MFPDMGEAFSGFAERTIVKRITKSVVDFEVEDSEDREFCDMFIYSMKAQAIILKPEGQRTWKWMNGVSTTELNLNDIIETDEGKKSKIMEKNDYFMAGYFLYDLTEKFNE